ncbi:DUF4229 domain-containing protein [Modestobacter sp. NPDC049651]|uniref:DUF4229 domain-containing protein n=1 Tax=unclassified Modestobacter TaxID=2643866 RepID=UPI0033D18093
MAEPTSGPITGPATGPTAGEVPAQPVGPAGGPAKPPPLAVPVLLLTVGRIVVFAALVSLLWVCGLGSFPGILFGLLLSMPVSYFLLRPLRDRVTEAIAARATLRTTRKEQLRAQLSGEDAGAAPLS